MYGEHKKWDDKQPCHSTSCSHHRRWRSLQQFDAHHLSVKVDVAVISTLKHQRCRSRCFWKFVRLHPIGKIVVHLRPHSFLSIREYASYYRLPLLHRVGGQYCERETLPYRNFRFHGNSFSSPTWRHPLHSTTRHNRSDTTTYCSAV